MSSAWVAPEINPKRSSLTFPRVPLPWLRRRAALSCRPLSLGRALRSFLSPRFLLVSERDAHGGVSAHNAAQVGRQPAWRLLPWR